MDTNGSTFDFEKYQKEHEGVVSKAWDSIKGGFFKILRFAETPVIVNILSLLFTIVMVFKACSSTDAGLIIEQRTADMQKNAKETMQFMYSVTLPDSIEKLEEVKEIRRLQRRMYAFELKNISLMIVGGIDDTDEPQMGLDDYIDYLEQQSEMINDSKIILSLAKKKNPKLNPFLLRKCIQIQNGELKKSEETTSNLRSIQNSNKSREQKVNEAIKIVKEQIMSKQYTEYNNMMHELNMAFITWSNTQLLLMNQ